MLPGEQRRKGAPKDPDSASLHGEKVSLKCMQCFMLLCTVVLLNTELSQCCNLGFHVSVVFKAVFCHTCFWKMIGNVESYFIWIFMALPCIYTFEPVETLNFQKRKQQSRFPSVCLFLFFSLTLSRDISER